MAGLLACSIANPAHAWSQETHQTTGAIAWADLTEHRPDVVAQLLAIAKTHQDYPKFAEATQGLPEATRQRALFEWLARWPDDIRTGPEDMPAWHYSLRVVSGRTWLWPVRNGEAKAGFAWNYAALSDPCAAPADRAKAIGWLIHIVGDIQQPLHAGHQMSGDFPATDRAGELAFVRRFAESEPTNLHQYWDRIFQQSRVDAPGGDWATALASAWPRSALPELAGQGTAEGEFARYIEESEWLAGNIGYTGTFLAAQPEGVSAPVVSAEENRFALILAGRRVATGGYRIANVLASALDRAKQRRTLCTA